MWQTRASWVMIVDGIPPVISDDNMHVCVCVEDDVLDKERKEKDESER